MTTLGKYLQQWLGELNVHGRTMKTALKSPDSRGKTTLVAARVEPDLADRLSKSPQLR